ncbi:MAG: hypothetical protein Q9181_002100 [Wetmoreana brouardii]
MGSQAHRTHHESNIVSDARPRVSFTNDAATSIVLRSSLMSANAALLGMVQLDACVYLYRPASELKSGNGKIPRLIVLCAWMLASSTNITKYIKGYQALYPEASILLIRSGPLDFAYRGRKALERRLQPALAVVRSTRPSTSHDSALKVLLHVFSNGGSLQAVTLLRSYLQETGHAFPLHSTVLDSCPGHATFNGAYRVLLLPWRGRPFYTRLPMVAFLYVTFGLWWMLMLTLRMENPFKTLWQGLNNGQQVQETQRVYVYSDVDDMVPWHDIEEHAVEAKEKGFHVQTEKFMGSGHVAHIRVGMERGIGASSTDCGRAVWKAYVRPVLEFPPCLSVAARALMSKESRVVSPSTARVSSDYSPTTAIGAR